MNLLNCREGKVTKIKKELTDCGLLYQKRQPPKTVNGKKEGQPNYLYLGKPEVTASDVFKSSDDGSECRSLHEPCDSNGSSQIAKIANNLLYSKDLDTNRHLIDSEKDQHQDQLLLDNFVDLMKEPSVATFIPERSLELIKVFSPSYVDAQQTVRTIHNAKYKAEKETDIALVFEELATYGINAEQSLYTTLLKAYQKQKTEKVANLQNLIFTYVKNWFVEVPCAAIKMLGSDQPLPKVSMCNWLEEADNQKQRSES